MEFFIHLSVLACIHWDILTFKVWIVKTPGNNNAPVFVPVKSITGNLMLDPIDTEKATTVKVFTHKVKDQLEKAKPPIPDWMRRTL